MSELALHPHPNFPSLAASAVWVDAGRLSNGELVLRFRVEGDLDRIMWPGFDKQVGRGDGLWHHTCFEAFIGTEDEPAYCEFNFTSSTGWAAYRFDAYREGMRSLEQPGPWGRWVLPAGSGEMHFRLPSRFASRNWRLGLSAVIEATDGSKSYWALAHGDGPPDFHNPDCFIATLPAPRST